MVRDIKRINKAGDGNMKRDGILRVLAINPGSTSTKVAVFDNETCVFKETIRHSRDEITKLTPPDGDMRAQKSMRKELLVQVLAKNGVSLTSLDAISGRAGRLPPSAGGVYKITKDVIYALERPLPHPGALGIIIAYELSIELGIPSYFVDPDSMDELDTVAKVTGINDIRRTSGFQALNHKGAARRAAKELGLEFEKAKIVVAHMGGGISVGAHKYGRTVDVTHPSNGEGPFSPERAGGVPGLELVELCFSGRYSKEYLRGLFHRHGGLVSLLGTSDMQECEKRMKKGDQSAREAFESLAYQVAKSIGSMTAVLGGQADAIVLTGGLAFSDAFCSQIKTRVEPMAGKIFIYPGEMELESLAAALLRVHQGKEQVRDFSSYINKISS